MTVARVSSVCVALAAAAALMSASSAANAKVRTGVAVDVSTRAAVVEYLRSIHVDPRGVVIERGTRNYAGGNCPGSAWTCTTTAHAVVQIAPDGGKNTFRCSTASCAVVQIASPRAATNTATCLQPAGHAEQECVISQSSSTADNKAVVYQSSSINAGLEQVATSSVSITQQATGAADAANTNEACVYQAIGLHRSAAKPGAVTLMQSAHQTVTIEQDSMYGGNSAAESATPDGQCTGGSLTQRQTLKSKLSGPKSIAQEQNVANDGANMTIDVEQNQSPGFLGVAYGENSANFDQHSALTAVANSPGGPVTQRQSSLKGGLLGTINQDSRDPSAASTTQTEIQCEDAATSGLAVCDTSDTDAAEAHFSLKQTQIGQVHGAVGTAEQTGNAADTFLVSQSSSQNTDYAGAGHQWKNLQGACATAGTCTVTQVADSDRQHYSNTQSGQGFNATTNCAGSVCVSSCPDASCESPDPNSILIAGSGDETLDIGTEPTDNLAQELSANGYSVTRLRSLPADVGGFGQVWWVDTSPPTPAERHQLVRVALSGRGVFLTGEIEGCCWLLDAQDRSMVNSMVTGGGINVGDGRRTVLGPAGKAGVMSVNPDVVGNLASQPHTLTSWTVTAAGGIGGVPDSSVFAFDQSKKGGPETPAAAAWDRPTIAGHGRLVLFMDINWAEPAEGGENWADVADNVAFFLSGLSTPPTP